MVETLAKGRAQPHRIIENASRTTWPAMQGNRNDRRKQRFLRKKLATIILGFLAIYE